MLPGFRQARALLEIAVHVLKYSNVTRSTPQPDFALLAPREDFYERQRPTAADAHLLIEVSDTTLRNDLRTKKGLYARHGVAELWVLNIGHQRLHVFRCPNDGDYQEARELSSPGIVPVSSLPGVEIDLSGVIG